MEKIIDVPTKKEIFISKDATNGDAIKALFPNINTSFSNVIDMNLWWNAPYKAESEKKFTKIMRKGEENEGDD